MFHTFISSSFLSLSCLLPHNSHTPSIYPLPFPLYLSPSIPSSLPCSYLPSLSPSPSAPFLSFPLTLPLSPPPSSSLPLSLFPSYPPSPRLTLLSPLSPSLSLRDSSGLLCEPITGRSDKAGDTP